MFAQLLANTTSDNNEVRRAAEAELKNATESNVQEVVSGLVGITQDSTQDKLHQVALITLKNIIPKKVFISLPTGTQEQVMQALLQVFGTTTRLSNASEAVCRLFALLKENKSTFSTKDLASFIHQRLTAGAKQENLWGLHLLEDCAGLMAAEITAAAAALAPLLHNFVMTQDEATHKVATRCIVSCLSSSKGMRESSLMGSLVQAATQRPSQLLAEGVSELLETHDKLVGQYATQIFDGFFTVAGASAEVVDYSIKGVYVEIVKDLITTRFRQCEKLKLPGKFVRQAMQLLVAQGLPDEEDLVGAYTAGVHDYTNDTEDMEFTETVMNALDSVCRMDGEFAREVVGLATQLAGQGTPAALYAALFSILAVADHVVDEGEEDHVNEGLVKQMIDLIQAGCGSNDLRLKLTAFRTLTVLINEQAHYISVDTHKNFVDFFVQSLQHPHESVRAYAIRLVFEYGPYTEPKLWEAVAEQVCRLIIQNFQSTKEVRIQAKCFSAVSFLCVKCPSQLAGFYDDLMNLAVEHACRSGNGAQARAIETVSRLGLAYGKERFLASKGMVLLQRLHEFRLHCSQTSEASEETGDVLMNYIDDAYTGFLQMLGKDFAEVFKLLVPTILQVMSMAEPKPLTGLSAEQLENYAILEDARGNQKGVHANVIRDMDSLLSLAASAVEVIGVAAHALGGEQIEQNLFRFLTYESDADLRLTAAMALAEFLKARYTFLEKNSAELDAATVQMHQTQLRGLTEKSLTVVIEHLSKEVAEVKSSIEGELEGEDLDAPLATLFAVRDETESALRCIDLILSAGFKDVLPENVLKTIISLVLAEIENHFSRIEEVQKRKAATKDEDEEAEWESEEDTECSIRNILNEVLTGIITSHPTLGPALCVGEFQKIISAFLAKKEPVYLEAAMIFACDWIEHADKHAPAEQQLTPHFLTTFVQHGTLTHKLASVRQPAAFALQKAFQNNLCRGAVGDQALQALTEAVRVGSERVKNSKGDARLMEQAALDNAVAAIFEAYMCLLDGTYQPTSVLNATSADSIAKECFSRLPLKGDSAENNALMNKLLKLARTPAGLPLVERHGADFVRVCALTYNTSDVADEVSSSIIEVLKAFLANHGTAAAVQAGMQAVPKRVIQAIEAALA